MVCVHARQVKAALSTQVNKTDQNDAHDFAHIVPGWCKSVEMKSLQSHGCERCSRSDSASPKCGGPLYNHVRWLLKPFSVVLLSRSGSTCLPLGQSLQGQPVRS